MTHNKISVISSRLISRQIQYKGTDKKPADLTIIEVLSDTSEVATCLLYCSKKTDCKSVVYEDTKCYLYSTSVGSLPLASGQKAIAEFSTDISTNLCTEPGTYCKHSSVFMTFTCACATDGFLDANPCTIGQAYKKMERGSK
ncbi:hypothetical protein LSH36_1329g00009 [Paralvinella palmiformis]|uniref:Apple domain-containing protein n=1 Tax=Paralvinella palmiformis TaxID=53620 RepID=A0AAD9IUD9_9ANNE|nr:hypothetical protein LSH36_1329g00009 [Paralvinella palmiformis]